MWPSGGLENDLPRASEAALVSEPEPLKWDTIRLAERLRCGDPAAEVEFYQRFYARLAAFALHRTSDPEAARELADDILLVVMRKLRAGSVRYPEYLTAFVFGTAHNLVKNFLRRRRRELQAAALPLELAGPDPSIVYETREKLEGLAGFLVRLQPADRSILELSLVDGMKPGEISARLEWPVELVRQRKARALKRVRQFLRSLD